MATLPLNGVMSLKLAHCWKRGNALYFRRRIPDDLRSHYGTKTHVVVSLGTSDPKVAAKEITRLTRETDTQWEHWRNPSRETELDLGRKMYASIGPEEGAQWAFADEITDLLPSSVKDDPDASHAQIDKALPAAHRIALHLHQNRLPFLASDCQREYVKARCKTERAQKDVDLAFKVLTDLHGDKDIREYTRKDANDYVSHLLAGGHREGQKVTTATVEKRVTPLRGAWKRAINEHENLHSLRNIWAALEILGKGEDSTDRPPFTIPDYRTLFTAIDAHGLDDRRCLLTLVACTGARLAEITGLAVADVKLDDEVPHLVIQPHPWRTLKTPGSTRKVPLVGARALNAAKELLRLAGVAGGRYLLPRYVKEGKPCNANSASATLIKWMRANGVSPELDNHSLRHGMKDLLRAVECSTAIEDAIIGHQTPGVGARYGQGYPLSVLRDWISKALEGVTH